MIIFARKISWNQFHEKFREIEYATLNWPVQLDSFMPQWSKESSSENYRIIPGSNMNKVH